MSSPATTSSHARTPGARRPARAGAAVAVLLALGLALLPAAGAEAATARFSLRLSTSRIVVAQGQEARVTVTVTRRSGFTSLVTLGTGTVPRGLTARWTATRVRTRAQLAVRAAPGTAVGTRALDVRGTAAGRRVTARLFVTVVSGATVPPTPTPTVPPTAPPTVPPTTVPPTTTAPPTTVIAGDFVLQVSPSSQAIPTGGTATYTVALPRTGGFRDPVVVTVENLPPGAGYSVTPNPVEEGAALRISVGPSTPAGSYPVTVRALSRTVTVELRVGADFSVVTGSLSRTAVPGGVATYPVAVSPTGGFTGPVALSASGLPAGVTARFSANPTSSGSVLTLDTTSAVALGTYRVTVTGTAMGIERRATVTLVVAPRPAEFTVTASPSLQVVTPGGATSYSLTVQLPPSGGPLVLTSITWRATGLPSGAKATFTPVAGSATTRMDVTTSKSTPAGVRTIQVSATYGNSRRTFPVALAVSAGTATQPFALSSPSPVLVAVPGGAAGAAIVVADNGGSAEPIAFGAVDVPSGVTISFSTATSTTGVTVIATTTTSVRKGTYGFTVVGVRGSVVRFLPMTLQVV